MENTTIKVTDELFVCAESSSFEGSYDLPEFSVGPDTYSFASPLEWQVSITNTSDALLVMGSVKGTARTECARCLEEVEFDIDGEVEGYFLLEGAARPDGEMEEDEFDHLDPSGAIDLVPLLQAAIIVDLPLVPLCDESCAGICQDCGMNLNEGSCDCAGKRQAEAQQEAEKANPFAALSALEFED